MRARHEVSHEVLIPDGTGTYVDDQGFPHDVTFIATITTNSDIDGTNGHLVLTSGKISLKLKEPTTGRHGSISTPFPPGSTLDLPAGSDGDWNLTLNLTPDGTKYTGTDSRDFDRWEVDFSDRRCYIQNRHVKNHS